MSKILSYTALLLSVVSLIISFYALKDNEIGNVLGGVLGGFTLLTSVLIGWQIYSSIDLKGVSQKVDKKIDEIDEKLQTVLIVVFNKNAELCRISGDSFGYLSSAFSILQAASSIKDFETCNLQIEAIMEYVQKDELALKQSQILVLINKLKSVSYIRRINHYEDLMSHLHILKGHG